MNSIKNQLRRRIKLENIKSQMELDEEYVQLVSILDKSDEEKIELVNSFSDLTLPEKITRTQLAKNQVLFEAKQRESAVESKKRGR